EFMDQESTDRLAELAKISWQRHFDDRLGLSPVEELNLSEREGEDVYPVTEPLLRDKPEHIIKRINKVEFDPKFGIKMAIPEYQYNLGELYNLSISRGTLTTEDRFKINEHVTSTIKMLENLPFPPELARVPRYASTHHETLKGTGYPRKLSAEDLSIPERILVVADIFEALTAADRPYKKAKSLSVAIDILYKMALDEHLDMDIFKLFLSSGIYLEYAHKFLDS
ncbi:HD-GYP domain-containing protein, partial [Shewanella sp. 0m-11]